MEIIKCRMINGLGKTKGCEKAPVEVLEKLKEIGSSEEGREMKGLNFEEIHVDLNNIEEGNELIYKNSEECFYKNDKVFFIGGDHSISYSIVKAFDKVEENPLVIVFDAHADCCEAGKEPDHEEWIRKLIQGGFNPNNIVLVGSRNLWEQEWRFIKETGITRVSMDVLQEDLESVCDMIMERARNSSGFYISIDIDVIDPGFAPGTGHLEPGGMSSRELIYFLKRLKLLDNFRGADIVEINPDKDFNGMTVKLGAKLLGEMV